jgi:hypothetical protein
MGRRAQEGGIWLVVLWIIIVLGSLAFVFVSVTDTEFGASINQNLPDAVGSVYDTVLAVFTPLVEGAYFVVAPSDACAGATGDCNEDNVRMIAFAIFLLLTLVGTKTLRPWIRGPFLAFFISVIIGVIAGRSLTGTVLKETALGASPIAAASLILGFIPVFAITQNIGKWGLTRVSEMVVYTVASAVYLFVFWFGFDSLALGITYAAGIVLLGAGQIIVPWFKNANRERSDENLGEFMAGVGDTVQTSRSMQRGAQNYQGRG